ncbi:MAG: site-2 protease family protein [Terracidiphilus sp.]
MSSSAIAVKVFEFVILLFSLSVHECAHAWMASRLGDNTARLQGRVTLNPIPHIDLLGTILFPAMVIFGPLFGFKLPFLLVGWAKPTPVITRNLKRIVRDDNIITLAGPASNLILALVAFLGLVITSIAVPGGRALLRATLEGGLMINGPSEVQALVVLALIAIEINITLLFFNLLPIPPLDGSHLLRNMLPYNAAQKYDRIPGWISYVLMIVFGGVALGILVNPVIGWASWALLSI